VTKLVALGEGRLMKIAVLIGGLGLVVTLFLLAAVIG